MCHNTGNCLVNRLVAFGCSYTFGHYLPDAIDPNGKHSMYSWPYELSKLLNIENVINKGKPGASNKEILYEIHKFDFDILDTVCILWTYHERDCIITPENIIQGYPNCSEKNVWYFDKIKYGDYDGYYQFWNSVNYAKLYLDNLNITNYHFSIDDIFTENPPKFNNVNIESTDIYTISETFPLALDNMHPGEQGHKQIAKNIKEKIFTQYEDLYK